MVLSAALLSLSTYSIADINKNNFAKCAAINGDLERLECFDSLAKDNKLDQPQHQATDISNTGKWQVDIKINPIDDSKTVVLYLVADSGKSSWRKNIVLVARCMSNKTDLYINWNDYLGSDSARVLSRIGTEKAVTENWIISTDKKSTFRSQPISFLKRMENSNKFIAQVTPYNDSPNTATFNTTGLSDALKPLRSECNW